MNHKQYLEKKRIGKELGINYFGVKSFSEHKGELKVYSKICYRCNKKFKIEKYKNTTYHKCLCEECKDKSRLDRFKKIRDKNKKKWEDLIISALKTNNKEMTYKNLALKLNCSYWTVYRRIEPLLKNKKIIKNSPWRSLLKLKQ